MSDTKLLEKRTHQVPGKRVVSEYFFQVPLDHAKTQDAKPQGQTLRLFARSVARFEKPVDPSKAEAGQLPWLLYLQGGPGMGCKAPQNYGWTERLLDRGYQILFLDQRGTGMSSTVTARSLSPYTPEEQADYLRHFRADSIVEDCEAIRKVLTADFPDEKKQWSILGQSFGGFCCISYLSAHPEGLKEVFICGGLAPLVSQPDPVYRSLFVKVAERNQSFYAKYPEDVQRVKTIVHHLQSQQVELPSGGTLSVPRFRQLGINFGFHGAIDAVHDLILRMASDLDYFTYFTQPTLAEYESLQSFDSVPLYALIHELIYLQGDNTSNWSADRVMQEYPAFLNLSTNSNDKEPIYFTGEMIFPSTFLTSPTLEPLHPTATYLARSPSRWPSLYDEARLAANTVPVYASAYLDDMYVSFDLALATARKIGACRYFATNGMYHNAISVAGKDEELMRELWRLRDDCMD